jgi:hypothetical protein
MPDSHTLLLVHFDGDWDTAVPAQRLSARLGE